MRSWIVFAALLLAACQKGEPPISQQLPGFEKFEGFLDMYWDESTGRLLFAVEDFDQPFLYQSSLARGAGSNDLGLDRGQLGATRVVEFHRSGPKILLIEKNLEFRAGSEDEDERRAVEESFAVSAIWGFESLGNAGDILLVDRLRASLAA